MFKKFREARARKKNKDVTELLAWQETALKAFDKRLAAIEPIPDAAEKILSLKRLIRDIAAADRHADNKKQDIADKRAYNPKKFAAASLGGGVGGIAAIVVPAALLCPPLIAAFPLGVLGTFAPMIGVNGRIEKKRKKFLAKNPELGAFRETLIVLESHAEEMLEKTETGCDLKEISQSPRFMEAFAASYSLSQRFAAAAAETTRQELEENAASPEPVVKAPLRKAAAYDTPKIFRK